MTLLEVSYGLIFHPVDTLHHLSQKKAWVHGIAVFLLVYAVNLITKSGIDVVSAAFTPALLPGSFWWVGGLLGALLSLSGLFIASGLFSLLSEIIYGKTGNASSVLTCLGFAVFPGSLGPPLHFLLARFNLAQEGVILSVLAVVWVMILQVLSIREAFCLKTGQAALIYFLPLIILLGIVAVMLGVAGLALTSIPLPW